MSLIKLKNFFIYFLYFIKKTFFFKFNKLTKKIYFFYLKNLTIKEEILLTINFMVLDWYSLFREYNYFLSNYLTVIFAINKLSYLNSLINLEYLNNVYLWFLDLIDNFCSNSIWFFEDLTLKFYNKENHTKFGTTDLDIDGRYYLHLTLFRNTVREAEFTFPEFTDSP